MSMNLGGGGRDPSSGHQRHAVGGRHAGAPHHHDADRADAPAGGPRSDAGGRQHRRETGHPGPDRRRDDSRGGFYVNLLPVQPDNLIPQVQRFLEDKKEKIVYLKGDKDAKDSAIMDVMDAFRKAQIENIALITEKKSRAAPEGPVLQHNYLGGPVHRTKGEIK